MYFKTLELIGFKSFAEKTRLNFEPGVTAVVGPNGTGKSNVADAIRWVLGEQSTKSLRASKMEDVIFNGTDTKEPINFAEVSLTLSNEKRILPIDYDEVTITRRCFRSGDNEYLINKTPVRLKDIAELLMGTGIGTESYSIIEQGKIDLILSSRPEDRRYIFEEASGITKYKSKKKEALRKLEQTEQNLLRINDIIQEVKRQITSIERQARKAEKYKVDFDKLKESELKLSYSEYKILRTQEKTSSVESQDVKLYEGEIAQELASLSAKISDCRQRLDGLSQNMSEVRNKRTEMAAASEMNLHKMEIDKERIQEALASQEALKKEIDALDEKIAGAKCLIEKLKEDAATLGAEKAKVAEALKDKELRLERLAQEIADTEERSKTGKIRIVDYLAKETRLKNELIKLGADIQNRKARERRLHIEKETVAKELIEAGCAAEAVAAQYDESAAKLAHMRSMLESKKDAEQTALSEIKSMESSLAEEETRCSNLRSKIEFLDDLVKKYEGFRLGVKNLLARMEAGDGAFRGVKGVLADLIKVKKGYEEAVAAVLGDDAQVIIVEKDLDIARAIEHLRENGLGKASFVSIEGLSRMRLPKAPHAAGLMPLKDAVDMDGRYEPIAEYFFANAYVVDSLDDIFKNNLGSAPDAKLVTRTGSLFDRGKFSGGSSADSDESLIIGRRDRLESLSAELSALEDETRKLAAARDDKRTVVDVISSEIASLGGELHQEEINLANIRMRKDAQGQLAKKLEEELAVVELELDEVSSAIRDLTQRGEALNTELNVVERERDSLERFIEEAQGIFAEKRQERERTSIDMSSLRGRLESFDREERAAADNLKKEGSALFELEESFDVKRALRDGIAGKAGSFEEECVRLRGENESLAERLKSLDEESSGLERSRSAIADTVSVDELQLKDREKHLEGLRNQIRDLDVKLTEIGYKKTNLRDRILQAYKANLEELHVEIEDNIDWDALKVQVAELKDKLEKIGPVNLVAIEEHKELEERHAFLSRQQDDLLNAKDSLHKAIQMINKTTKELFIETFQKIQVEFKNFFRLLFGGGQAELVLIDEQDILESGIEIIIRPPGKKLQNIMLLSGGEKALTAIALLFAIFKVKPSPFCVLDEIDAPLDESNIVRFSNVLKDFLKISQFIIITHNKRTIELADVMYGITMQERGVSKIVSVKFSEGRKKEEPVKAAA